MTPIRAPARGVVRDVWWNVGGGRMIAITHDGLETRYAHLSSSAVRPGELVNAGQVIGYSGATGTLVRGAHLHFEVWTGGRAVDPAPYLAGSGVVTEDAKHGKLTRQSAPGTFADMPLSGGGRCDVQSGWFMPGPAETFFRSELTGFCRKDVVTDALGDVVVGAAGGVVGALAGDVVPIVANAALVVAALLIGWGGVRRVLDAR